jgi:hypothetical protein
VRKRGVAVGLAVVALIGVTTSDATGNSAASPSAPASEAAVVKKVTVAGSTYAATYYVVDATYAIARIPSTYAKVVAAVIRKCRTAGFYGLISGSEVGVVVWLPRNPLTCFTSSGGVIGGGPGGHPSEPCVQLFRTPGHAYFVLFVGTSWKICANLSVEAPGGWEARTTQPVRGLAAGSSVLVKCQQRFRGTLYDYVAPPIAASSLPASRYAYWIYDAWVDTGGRSDLPNVPKCAGFNLSF